ncbi:MULTISPECIES: dihydrofolate reductase family protein [unclassified Arthrobacter]|uniref:dihydrofolate reductase family protein n=1 Tax=unclassified Arthrobacter TaxID=235627 RepID=UPI00159E9E14|nr:MULTISPECIES: dihydrofolate reductase family protein [unclassified Arthrobacter]MCQ9162685.1 dihydrofolate reductase family protein [Arthrobacter sp. STN4]NVM97332.1 dihydrofolate reductase [Arthrobacter sp. SDTb3-6]
MTRTVYYTASTLNGFLADPDNSLAWLFAVDDAGAPDIAAFMDGMGVLVEGSTTYEWVLREEKLLENPARWQQLYGTRPTYVFTTRALPVPDGADVRLVRGPVADALPDIVAAAGEQDVWVVGGGELAGQFLDIGALDGLVVTLAPALLAGGAPMLPRNLGPDRLELRGADMFGQFAQLSYAVKKAAPVGP